MKFRRRLCVGCIPLALLVAVVSPLSSPARAAFSIWDGGGRDDNWTTNANWLDIFGGPGVAPPPAGNNDIIMPASGGMVRTPIVDVPYTINSLTFNNGNGRFVILAASELTIGAGGITNNDADIQSVIGPVKLSANQTWNAAAGRLQMDAFNLNGFQLTLEGAHPIDSPSVIVGNGDLIVDDTYTSTVTMSGGASNTYAGVAIVQNGTLVLQKSGGATAIPGQLNISDATVRLGADEQISHAAGIPVFVSQVNGLLDLNGHTETIATLNVFNNADVTTGAGSLIVTQTLQVTNGGTVTGNLSLGDVTASITFFGTIATGSNLIIGDAASGSLNIDTGGDVSNDDGIIGNQSGATGTVTVNGAGSTWTNSGSLIVGNVGSGTLNITNSGRVSNAGNSTIGSFSTGSVTVDGVGSNWDITNLSSLTLASMATEASKSPTAAR